MEALTKDQERKIGRHNKRYISRVKQLMNSGMSFNIAKMIAKGEVGE